MQTIKSLVLVIISFFASFLSPPPQTISPPTPTKILDSGLPDQHLINTGFVPQAPRKNWDQPWQDACEEASLLTVHYYYTQHPDNTNVLVHDLQQIFNYETQQGWGHDVNLDQMAQIASQYYPYHTSIIENPSLQDIKTYLSKDIPIIVTANGKTLYRENKNFRQGGPWYHSVVILGYDDHIGKFIVHDVGTQHGAYFKYTYQLLLDSIHDFPTTQRKEDIDTGSQKILILLK